MRGRSRSRQYALIGFLLGALAPLGWLLIRSLLFGLGGQQGFFEQILFDLTRDPEHRLLYLYMGGGTSLVFVSIGSLIGRTSDELHVRAEELDRLHREVASQKAVIEDRFRLLDANIKSFHQISSRIQRTLNLEEVLLLCAEGLHDILGYERVNVLMIADHDRHLRFVTAAGSEAHETQGMELAIVPEIGVIYKSIVEGVPYLIDDVTRFDASFHLQPPYDRIECLRSRSFIICPIKVKGETIGALAIDNKRTHRLMNESDLDTIMLFADEIAGAVTRIKLLTSIDTLTSELDSSFAFLLSHRPTYTGHIGLVQRSIVSVVEGAGNIAVAADGAAYSVEATRTAVHRITMAADEVTRNLDTLTGVVVQSATAMEQIARNITSIEQSAAQSHQVSRDVQVQTAAGRTAVHDTIEALAAIQSSVEASVSGITRLAEKSSRIEHILNVINDIGKRTNLLALNASIIANQAGEQGKGFGVVAEEIRNLSVKTGHSTGEINGIVEDIIRESRSACDLIAATSQLVLHGVDRGHTMGATFQEIYQRSKRSMEMTQQIEQVTQEQGRSVQLVARSMEDISTMTAQIFGEAKEQVRASHSIATAVETIKDMLQEMVRLTSAQLEDSHKINTSVDAMSGMVHTMFDNMDVRRSQAVDVLTNLESMKSTTCQL